jgi:UDP-N-acetylmuramate--alanine ligase
MGLNTAKKIHFTPKAKVHFMGVGGSAISAIALMAQRMGFKISGCDLEKETAYLKKVKDEIKEIYLGHDKRHLEGVDLLVVSPSVFYQNKNHPEVKLAEKKGILLTWQEFLGKYLQKSKKVLCVAGTHGKSTTTAMLGLVFEAGGKDPSAVVGAKVIDWDANFRFGKGDYFITEADEFYDNFLNYNPEAIILNNIEFDHPDYFSSEKQIFESFSNFLKQLTGEKLLIVNQDSPGIKRLFENLDENFLNSLEVYGYTLKSKPTLRLKRSVLVRIIKQEIDSSFFKVTSESLSVDGKYQLLIPGVHNILNSLGVIILARLCGIDGRIIKKVLANFKGIGRRLEKLGKKRTIKVYDDYAHHPTEIKETLAALRQRYPKEKIWAIVEPHSFSRTKALLPNYRGVFEKADEVIIGPIFKARDKKTFGVSGESIIKASGHKRAIYLKDLSKIVDYLKNKVKPKDVILVMGAGKSYKWAREILRSL